MLTTINILARQRISIIIFPVLILGLSVMCNISSAKIIYVDSNRAEAANDGTSWQDAYVFLQDAIVDAKRAEKPVEIRVAKGIYKPDMGGTSIIGDRKAAFVLVNGVTLAGGYAGSKQSDPDIRDIELYETILSGDLGVNDIHPSDISQLLLQADRAENTYNIVIASYVDNTAVIDGFTITSGNADDYLFDFKIQSAGGGLFCTQSEPVISNCTFTMNAASEGGALYNYNSNPTITNCTFDKNSAIGDIYGYGGAGGAINNFTNSSPTITNCIFTENSGYSGGAIYNSKNNSTAITDCSFVGNHATTNSGGAINNLLSNPVITNCTFEANIAIAGGAMSNYESMPVVTGCSFNENTAESQGGGIYNKNSDTNLTDCTFSENSSNTDGGAIFNESCMNPVITNCTFIANNASSGGGIYNNNTMDYAVKSCTFTGNQASVSGAISNLFSTGTYNNCLFTGNSAIYNCVGLLNIANNLTVTNCTFADNMNLNQGNTNLLAEDIYPDDPPVIIPPGYIEFVNCIIRNGSNTIWDDENSIITVSYSNVAGGWEGTGNIDEDPLFAAPGYWNSNGTPNDSNDDFWVDGDYHLKSQAGRYDPVTDSWVIDDQTSPCIDAGDPGSLIGDEPEPNGGIINMGAYGGTAEASLSPPEEVNVNEDDDGTQVILEPGQILVVTLESNPTTGYSWAVVEKQDSILAQQGDSEFVQPEQNDGIVGAGGWEVFRVMAVNTGQETLELVYRRSWETDADPAKTFSIDVIVN